MALAHMNDVLAVHVDFPDFDCRWAGHISGATGPSWSDFREALRSPAGTLDDRGLAFTPNALALADMALSQGSPTACVSGFAAACLALHLAQRACDLATLVLPSLLELLATSWPVLRFLSAIHRSWTFNDAELSCEGTYHPSIDWDEIYNALHLYAIEGFDEYRMETLTTDALEHAIGFADGIVWKFSSGAEFDGRSIGSWTNDCPLGAMSAFVLRAASLVLGELDVYKMVEATLLQIDSRVMQVLNLDELLSARWPLIPLLHKLSCMRRRHDDLTFQPREFQLNALVSPQAEFDYDLLSPAAARAASMLLVAAPGPVLICFVGNARAKYLKGYVQHASSQDYLGRTLFLPQSDQTLNTCKELDITCLPVISVYPELAKYAVLALSARLRIHAVFTDFEVYWVRNPFSVLHTYRNSPDDIIIAQEFYSNQTRTDVMLVRATERSSIAMANLAAWLLRFPFSTERPAIRYLLEPHRPAYVPSVSFLRADMGSTRGVLYLGVLDSESLFVSSDGWFGDLDSVVSFRLQTQLSPDVMEYTLDMLYDQKQGGHLVARQLVQSAQRLMTPKRPMQALQQGDLQASLQKVREKPPDPFEQILHVNFADGCCEKEQAKSSQTALEFGANESRALNGSALSSEFRARNAKLLTWQRGADLTAGKTPSGKVGYYVWKPYVLLQTLKDPNVAEGTVVLWTDAGVHFIAPLRPLVQQYLSESDVTATETPMQEAGVTKRDAFLLLEADFGSIVQTNQIATGIIIARKTPLAIRFVEDWLRACEDWRIITEEPSSMGYPDYHTFRHHNDDQSAFSLLFKKYGFQPFSQAERDEVVLAARNIAKFLAASDAFALGRSVSQDDYIAAANAAAA